MIKPNYELLKEVDQLMSDEDKLFDPMIKCSNCGCETILRNGYCLECGENCRGD